MLKKILLLLLTIFVLTSAVRAAEPSVTLYFFWSNTCPHCQREKAFLTKLAAREPRISVRDFEVTTNADNAKLFMRVSRELGNDRGLVPFTVIGESTFNGYYDDASTGAAIESAVKKALSGQCEDLVAPLLNEIAPTPIPSVEPTCAADCACTATGEEEAPTQVKFPLIGKINLQELSLPALSVVLGLLDGFNPCAMWALLFLISLLLGMENRTKSWLLGVAFLLTSAFVYFLFMAAWLKLFLFLGFVSWLRYLIGLAALVIAVWQLREFIREKEIKCKAVGIDNKKKLMSKMRSTLAEKHFWPALAGIILLAFAVNLVELVCSAGFPAVFTNILSLNNLQTLQYFFYLWLYLFFFLLDDLLVFFAAMFTLQATGLATRYTRWSKLIGGLLILLIGILLIFKPQWLMFA